ncbi:MAG TPA: hypothetical protein VGO47_13260 [Chlamydiales bacterium]|nr:hypothetical protein [Chlamydiales bacterium]
MVKPFFLLSHEIFHAYFFSYWDSRDYYKAGHHIESGSLFNRYIYDLALGDSLRNLIKKHLDIFWDETRFSVAELLARPFVRMRYYCDVVNSHLGGFKDANDYYRKASCVQRIRRVRTPILAINSRDDPVSLGFSV